MSAPAVNARSPAPVSTMQRQRAALELVPQPASSAIIARVMALRRGWLSMRDHDDVRAVRLDADLHGVYRVSPAGTTTTLPWALRSVSSRMASTLALERQAVR